jgi:K+-transporting ATPase KdpF subunit
LPRSADLGSSPADQLVDKQSLLSRFVKGRVNFTMTIVAAIVAVLLLGYLVVALVRPEKF